MSPLRFIGSLVAGRLSSRRICGQALGSVRILQQSRNFASGAGGAGFTGRLPMGESHRSVLAVGGLSLLGGGMLYLKEDPEEPAAHKLIHQEESFEEKAMKKRFEEWMINYDRKYKNKKEKAMRYEIFKSTARRVDGYNAANTGCTYETNDFADKSREELRSSC